MIIPFENATQLVLTFNEKDTEIKYRVIKALDGVRFEYAMDKYDLIVAIENAMSVIIRMIENQIPFVVNYV